MRKSGLGVFLLAAMLQTSASGAQNSPSSPVPAQPPEVTWGQMLHYPSVLTFDRLEGQPREHSLRVTSASFDPNGEIPLQYSGPGGSLSPDVSWTPGPTGTRSYVLLFEDGVANRNSEGILHWLAFNIPATVTNLPEGLSVKGTGLKQPLGTMKEGANIDQTVSYTGMYGGPTGSHYRLQIFALDTLLDLPSGATRDEVWEGMSGHVLANGELMAYFRAPAPANPPEAGSSAALTAAANLAASVYRGMFLPSMPTVYRPQGRVTTASLAVSSPSFAALGPSGIIPTKYTGRGASISPEVVWSKGPRGTKSYVLVFEDGLANKNGAGMLHWLAYDIPAKVIRLPEGLSAKGRGATQTLGTMKEGLNDDEAPAYSGMMGIPGAPSIHYHLQIFALDTLLGIPAGATRTQIWQAMSGHVLAKGQTIAFFQPLGPAQVNLPPAPRRP